MSKLFTHSRAALAVRSARRIVRSLLMRLCPHCATVFAARQGAAASRARCMGRLLAVSVWWRGYFALCCDTHAPASRQDQGRVPDAGLDGGSWSIAAGLCLVSCLPRQADAIRCFCITTYHTDSRRWHETGRGAASEYCAPKPGLSLIHISEPTRLMCLSRMPSSA